MNNFKNTNNLFAAIDVLYAFLLTIAFLLLIIFINKFFRKFYDKLKLWKDAHIHGIKFQKLEIVSSAQITYVLLKAAKFLRFTITVLLLYFYVPLVLSFFPWTRGYSTTLFGYIVSPLLIFGNAFLNYLPNIFILSLIVAITHYALKLIKKIFIAVGKGMITLPDFYPDWALPTYKIVRFLILSFAAVVAFPYLPGSDSLAFKGISVFLGVIFSFGSAGAISNIVSGIILTYMRAFTIGDRVKISDTVGDIIEKTLLVTRIRTIKNEDITLPNSMVLNAHIINYSSSAKNAGLILHTTVTIGYDAPWKKVHELLINAAKSTDLILKEPSPFVLQTNLNDFYVTYEINAYTDQPNKMANIYADLHRNIQDKFNEGGVEIMSPHYTQIRDGNKTAIPAEYLPKEYQPSGIRLKNLGNDLSK